MSVVSTALHSSAAPRKGSGGQALPGVGMGSIERRAPSAGTPDGQEQSEADPGVPQGWWDAVTGAHVAGGNAGTRALPERAGQPQPTLPSMPRGASGPPSRARTRATREVEAAVARALERAREDDWWHLASPQSWEQGRTRWKVPSRTEPGKAYTVWIVNETNPDWWRRLACSCPAGQDARYLVCWHRAAVHLRLMALKR